MEKSPHSAPEPTVKKVMERLSVDLKKSHTPRPLSVELCFQNEDVEVVKQKYKVLSSSSSVANKDHLSLRCRGGCQTSMLFKDKKVQIPGNVSRAVGRTWLKEFTKKYEAVRWMVSLPNWMGSFKTRANDKKRRKKDILDRLYVKVLLNEFVSGAKTRARAIKEEGAEEGPFCVGPRRWDYNKKMFVSMKKQSSNAIIVTDKEQDA
ncbi:hypothetical protein LXL04_027744 [Taraxacum kok-saghyz]